jgi:hypothetical protein
MLITRPLKYFDDWMFYIVLLLLQRIERSSD